MNKTHLTHLRVRRALTNSSKPGTPFRGSFTAGRLPPNVDRLATFATDAATKTGRSARTVRRLVAIGEKLDEEAAETLADTYRP